MSFGLQDRNNIQYEILLDGSEPIREEGSAPMFDTYMVIPVEFLYKLKQSKDKMSVQFMSD